MSESKYDLYLLVFVKLQQHVAAERCLQHLINMFFDFSMLKYAPCS